MISSEILKKYRAQLLSVPKNKLLFNEGGPANNYFQVESGQVRMYILNPDGQEFTQGIFNAGDSFGEPAVLGEFPYPSSAIAVRQSKIWRLPKPDFMQLLKENFDIHLHIDRVLCQRLQYKAMILTEVSSYDPEHRLMTILNYFKSKLSNDKSDEEMIVPFTRQQLADMTGLRVETVIRTIKKMEAEGKLSLEDKKIKL